MNETNYYRAGIYLRLSKEDKDVSKSKRKTESDSITNQKALIFQFLKSMNDVYVYDVYVDDGYSGTQFTSRPNFMRMQEDIYSQKINMVVVKDLSRFGRDHIETDRWIQKIFPTLGVRFVSVVDHYDSLTATHSDQNLVLPFKNFLNDNYSRDTSYKIRTSQAALRDAGQYIGAYVSYGYIKSKTEKGKLSVDSYSAEIVRKIFSMKIQGKSPGAIAIYLNELGILAPSEYKKTIGIHYKSGFITKPNVRWSAVTVKRILTNRIYTGVLEQGKRSRISYKVRKVVERPSNEWSVAFHHHKEIISTDEFHLVQKLLAADTRIVPSQKESALFSGMLYCSDCKKGMTRRKVGEKVTYICSTYNKGKGCSRHTVTEYDLKKIILKSLQMQIELFAHMDQILCSIDTNHISQQNVISNEEVIAKKKQELERLSQFISRLYSDRSDGVISETEFMQFQSAYEEKREFTRKAIENIQKEIKQKVANRIKKKEWIRELSKQKNLYELDHIMLVTMIDRIEICKEKKLIITFSYEDQYLAFQHHGKEWYEKWREQQIGSS